jgi:hypothetical protein
LCLRDPIGVDCVEYAQLFAVGVDDAYLRYANVVI